MLRYKFVASVIPLVVVGYFARDQIAPSVQPCIATADSAVQLAEFNWQAQRRVSFTTQPADATVRVRIVDSPESADFTVVDDARTLEDGGCSGTGPAQLIGIDDTPERTGTVIYLSHDGDANYRIYVRSRTFSVRDAAALLVGAHAGRPQPLARAL
ncbi:hypothetical protein JQ557_02235 [Bradyrhizobium sp. U87765 SZCCT0131]|uniref:hypothetical protein n=1 Tax=unclassified Bradyrhizobium TaxID=2631580 RepID=UPI001BAD5865|nr:MULTISPECIES: hypothetical protein [unclassified Bradyrhizobium]MBR1216793.1 hypothetical protein [Bradyrhizobium sp. U87765 SZCCT0131]MBR1259451.1 hypothetical protein [Bradyrhizobium sp. U87765 SZCCT0134]MBR1305592.1 hypothetical protein [Bradyrhizobium sp. U87765 SZCCT0110]MBR1321959.1 hypothetical protein [Bradyrhizobium sp. U87765 SZCCT0109]MBR1350763.1 hypothetical protein [Bradyrhizobium sp. U87765 SZCCT0048]